MPKGVSDEQDTWRRVEELPEARTSLRLLRFLSLAAVSGSVLFHCIACALPAPGSQEIGEPELMGCFYVPDSPEDQFAESSYFDSCVMATENEQIEVMPEHLERLLYDDGGLAVVRALGRHFYVNRQGVTASVVTYDNGADDFVGGRARTLQDGKVGFIDQRLRLVIPARYDWAFPFAEGRSLVCNGCTTAPPDQDGHRRVVGGFWGYIDIEGREVVPIIHPCEQLDSIGGRVEWCLPDAVSEGTSPE